MSMLTAVYVTSETVEVDYMHVHHVHICVIYMVL